MSASDSPEFDPLTQCRLRYAHVLARIALRNAVRLILSPRSLEARPLRFPNRTPDLWAGWLGHATVLLNLFGSRVLTDPLLTEWLGPLRRLVKLPLRPQALPPLDVITITHAHCDHLNRASLRRLPRRATLVVPSGCGDLVADLGFPLVELGWGEEATFGELTIQAFRPRHWGRRPPLGGERGYNAYLLTRRGWSVLVGGDSAYTGAYKEACRGSRVALALLPIGCYKPKLFELAHLTPEQALRTFREVGADYLLPVHWGTLIISLEPPAEPPRRLMAEASRLGLADRVRLVWPGGDFAYPGT
jgi:L-ascorbate metabolism protein UlaG (beta-lactamase superfamily)